MEKRIVNLEIEEVGQLFNSTVTVRPGGDGDGCGADVCEQTANINFSACEAEQSWAVATGCFYGAVENFSGGWTGAAYGCLGGAYDAYSSHGGCNDSSGGGGSSSPCSGDY